MTQPSSNDCPLTDSHYIQEPDQEPSRRIQDNCLLAQKADLPSYKPVHGSWQGFPWEQITLLRPQAQFQPSWAQSERSWRPAEPAHTYPIVSGTNGEAVSAPLRGSTLPSTLLSRCCPGGAFPRTVQDKDISSGTSGPSHGSPVSFC